MQTYTNLNGEECVIVINPDGSIWSGLKSAYDEMTAASTLPSNSSIPQAGE
jgi:hypothetical protein